MGATRETCSFSAYEPQYRTAYMPHSTSLCDQGPFLAIGLPVALAPPERRRASDLPKLRLSKPIATCRRCSSRVQSSRFLPLPSSPVLAHSSGERLVSLPSSPGSWLPLLLMRRTPWRPCACHGTSISYAELRPFRTRGLRACYACFHRGRQAKVAGQRSASLRSGEGAAVARKLSSLWMPAAQSCAATCWEARRPLWSSAGSSRRSRTTQPRHEALTRQQMHESPYQAPHLA